MGRPLLNGFFAMSNAQRQKHYRMNLKERNVKRSIEHTDTEASLREANQEIDNLNDRLALRASAKYKELIAENERLKENISELEQANKDVAAQYREMKLDRDNLRRQLHDLFKEKRKLEHQLKEALSRVQPPSTDLDGLMNKIGSDWCNS